VRNSGIEHEFGGNFPHQLSIFSNIYLYKLLLDSKYFKKMKKIILIILALFFTSTSVFAEVDYQEAISKFQNKVEADSRINSIRGYIKIQFDKTKLYSDDFLNRKPTEYEKNAIIAYIAICEHYLNDIGSSEKNIDLKFEGDNWISILYKLRDGLITYLDHKKFTAGYERKTQEMMDKFENAKILNLICVYDSPKELAGLEISVRVDFTNNRIWASKGESQKNFVISDNQFQYTMGTDMVTTISRSSGSLIITTPTLGVFARGSCSEAKQKKF
jgi:hypothetical protein